ncbi:MAG: TlpA family protein disulfide reductase [Ruminococcaceae bacterium]|nr:TlpA family protein disulfide reductase [Oscillospiraceae bacterium]
MKKIVGFILGILLFVLLIVLASTAYKTLTEKYSVPQMNAVDELSAMTGSVTPEQEEKPDAPDFTVTDRDGNEVKLSDFAGKPVVVNFWATWCTPCKSELPAFEDAYKEYGEDVVFMMVNLSDSRDTLEVVNQFVADGSYEFPLYFDSKHDASATYGIYSIPMTLFVSADGKLDAGYIGALNETVITSQIEQLLGE